MQPGSLLLLSLLLSFSPAGADLLTRTLAALEGILAYLGTRVADINTDAVFTARLAAENMEAILNYEPLVFTNVKTQMENLVVQAHLVADRGMEFLRQKPQEYDSKLGFLLHRSKKLIWYPFIETFKDAYLQPPACEKVALKLMDECMQEIGGNSSNVNNPCNLSVACLAYKTKQGLKDYFLTHQILYWQLAEKGGCVSSLPNYVRGQFCSNVMRDAENIAYATFPRSHRDLFLEQIALCGLWGFRDFYKPEWLDVILSWQERPGCYADFAEYDCMDDFRQVTWRHKRIKRNEIILPDNCLSHKTGVALVALTVCLRFEAERQYILQLPTL